MSRVAMKVIVNIQQLADPAIQALAMQFKLSNGDGLPPDSSGDIAYLFNANGESFFSPDAYALCTAKNVRIEKGMFFIELPTSTMDNLVDVDLPDSKYIDAEGVEQRRRYNEYFRFNEPSVNEGMTLVQLVHFPYDHEYVPGGVAGGAVPLTDENRRLFETELGVTAMVKAQGLALKVPSE